MKNIIFFIGWSTAAIAQGTIVKQCETIPFEEESQEYVDLNSLKSTELNWYHYASAKTRPVLFLNFDNKESCFISEDNNLEELISRDKYREIKAVFAGDRLKIYVTVRRKEYAFEFAPETNISFMIGKNAEKFLPYREVKKGESFPATSNANNYEVYPNWAVSINNIFYSAPLIIKPNARHRVMGLKFIKGFNWIIDFKSKKVFIKKNTISFN